MRILWKGADDFDVGVCRRVGLINNARRGLSSRDKEQGGPHVLRLRDPVRHARPDAEFLQGSFAVLASWYRVDVNNRLAPVTQNLGEVETGLDIHALSRVLRSNELDVI